MPRALDPRQAVAKTMVVGIPGPEVDADLESFLAHYPVGGVCLFRRNVVDRFQVSRLTSRLCELTADDLLITVDQEGGSVVRMLDLPVSPGAMALGAAGDPELTRRIGRATGTGLAAVGVNVDLAPVLDVNDNPDNPVIGDRSFGASADTVISHGLAFLDGLREAGVMGVGKHFPGHGDTALDSHLELPTVAHARERLESVELRPFRAAIAAGIPALMTAHLLVPALDPDWPATLSAQTLRGLLREEWNYDGIVMTDALDMKAVADRWDQAESSRLALLAGADLVTPLASLDETAAIVDRVAARLGTDRLPEARVREALRRRDHALAAFPPPRPDPGRVAGMEAEWAAIDDAAARALTVHGNLSGLLASAGQRVLFIAPGRETGGGVGDKETVADALVAAMGPELPGLTVATYDPAAPAPPEGLDLLSAGVSVIWLVSTARRRTPSGLRELAQAVRILGRPAGHLCLGNPFTAGDLPLPALLTFGLRLPSLRAAARVLAGIAAPSGRLPVPLPAPA
jgi:beta-N-acetylhexosaminidase